MNRITICRYNQYAETLVIGWVTTGDILIGLAQYWFDVVVDVVGATLAKVGSAV